MGLHRAKQACRSIKAAVRERRARRQNRETTPDHGHAQQLVDANPEEVHLCDPPHTPTQRPPPPRRPPPPPISIREVTEVIVVDPNEEDPPTATDGASSSSSSLWVTPTPGVPGIGFFDPNQQPQPTAADGTSSSSSSFWGTPAPGAPGIGFVEANIRSQHARLRDNFHHASLALDGRRAQVGRERGDFVRAHRVGETTETPAEFDHRQAQFLNRATRAYVEAEENYRNMRVAAGQAGIELDDWNLGSAFGPLGVEQPTAGTNFFTVRRWIEAIPLHAGAGTDEPQDPPAAEPSMRPSGEDYEGLESWDIESLHVGQSSRLSL